MKKEKKLPVIWPGYETVAKLGAGGYGTVYKVCKEDASGRYYSAVKKISIPANENEYYSLTENGYNDEEITSIFTSRIERIESEFRLMEKFKGDSHIVSYLEHQVIEKQYDEYDGADILIRMELLTGLPARYLSFSDREIVRLGIHICSALETIQRFGIIHRDIKPSNILYNDQLGYYKLADFGIAKVLDHATKGTMIGTADYIAPEVYNKEAYGVQADQYSLGLVLYWALNERKLPFLPLDRAPTDDEIQTAKQKRVNGEAFPAPEHGSGALQAIVLRACSFGAGDRFANISEMRRALEACLPEADKTPYFAEAEPASTKKDPPEGDDSGPDTPGSPDEENGPETPADPTDDDETMGRFGREKKPGAGSAAASFSDPSEDGPKKTQSAREEEEFANVYALVDMAERYRLSGGPEDIKKAEELTASALRMTTLDQVASEFAFLYDTGDPSPYDKNKRLHADPERGRIWHERARDLGDANEMYFAAHNYKDGSNGYPRDYKKALMWINKAFQTVEADPKRWKPSGKWQIFGEEAVRLKNELEKLNEDPMPEQASGFNGADFGDLFGTIFGNGAASGLAQKPARSARDILREYLPLISSPDAKNCRYEIAPDIDPLYLESIYKKWVGYAAKSGNQIRNEIRDSGQTVLAVFNSGYSNLRYPGGTRIIFTDKAFYCCGPAGMVPWYVTQVNGKEKNRPGYGCYYNVISRVQAGDHFSFHVFRRLTLSLLHNAQNYQRFEIPVEKKYFNEEKLVEMIQLLSKV